MATFLSCARIVSRSAHRLNEADKGLKFRVFDCCVDIVLIDNVEPTSRLVLVGVNDTIKVRFRDFVESLHGCYGFRCLTSGKQKNKNHLPGATIMQR